MAERQNFTGAQRMSAFRANAEWLRDHSVSGTLIDQRYEHLQRSAQIYYCENCLFCQSDQTRFDIDHLVPDKLFKDWGRHDHARSAINMLVLCKSKSKGDLGCNQSKGAKTRVPERRGLAYTYPDDDLNCMPLSDRPFDWT